MLPFNEIKQDIKNGYRYMEYEGKWYDYGYTITIEKAFESFSVLFIDSSRNFYAEYHTNYDEFLGIKSYKEYVKFMNEVLYYCGYTVGDEE